MAPSVNTETMNVFLRMASEDLDPDDHAVMIMARAGWHVAKKWVVPENITILVLPLYSPELNPVENLWHCIKSHHTSNRAYAGYDDLMNSVTEAWRSLTDERLRAVCSSEYIMREIE